MWIAWMKHLTNAVDVAARNSLAEAYKKLKTVAATTATNAPGKQNFLHLFHVGIKGFVVTLASIADYPSAPQTTTKTHDTTTNNSSAEPKEENVIPPVIVSAGTSEEKPVNQ
uniref:Uncharacterized protein n=1 Tax=Tanacetum cinerariifolium TaxID=118510 RepID=A0A6L2LLF7_TANCI|nr:hypothetical protein [Tanacetum cinerariifolium]